MRYAAKIFGYSFGVAYLLLSLVGFGITSYAVTSFSKWIDPGGEHHLVFFQMIAFQNLVHMLLGMALLAGSAGTEATARRTVLLVGLVFLVVGISGFYVVGQPSNFMGTNEATSTVHIATALAALIAAAVSQPGGGTAEEAG